MNDRIVHTFHTYAGRVAKEFANRHHLYSTQSYRTVHTVQFIGNLTEEFVS